MAARTCENCGHARADVVARPSGTAQCDPCYRAALAHGHLHVDHDPYADDCRECTLCEGEREEDRRIARALGVSRDVAKGLGR